MNPATRLLRAVVRTLARVVFRVRVLGLEHYHAAGERVLIVANHVSLLDGVLLYLFLPEPPTFAINTIMASKRRFRPFYAFVDLFVLDPTNPLSTKSLIKYLRQDRKAVIFPEGRITVTGKIMKIYEGPGMVADRSGAVILPVGIDGPQHSPWSYMRGLLRIRWFPRVTLRILPPQRISLPDRLQGDQRRKAAARMLTDIMYRIGFENRERRTTLFEALIEAAARHGPEQPVVEDMSRQPLTYRQLLTRAFVLGAAIARATRAAEHVGILLPNSAAAVVTFFAVLARGRVPAMLNFSGGPQALVTACETGAVRTVYTSRRFIESAGLQASIEALAARVRLVYLEDLRQRIGPWTRLAGTIAARAPRLAFRWYSHSRDPDDTGVLLFTSGSEGIPKGVVLSHANLLANRAQIHSLIDLTRRDLVFNCMPVFHSFGLTGGVLLPLLEGARVFLYPSPLHYRLIPELCYELGATALFGTNTFLAGYARYAHPYDFYTMRFVVAGAERLQEDTRRLWAEKHGIRVLEGYGATEASPVIAVNTPMANKPGTVGRLLTAIDHYLEPISGLKHGGRLVIRGPNVMRGYLFHGQEEIIPPATDRGPGWYDTGDVVSVDEDGFVTIVGRARRFAKIGGEMVSLAAVEDLAASAWPEGVHAAVAMRDAKRGEQILLVTDHPAVNRRGLVEAARGNGYSELAVPRRIVHVEQVPMLGNGKVDYRALRDLLDEEAR